MINPERKKEITHDVINTFINGTDGEERIVNLEYQSRSDKITIYYRDENDIKRTRQENFYPFVWATRQACERLCNGDREEVKRLMRKYGISIKVLDTKDQEGKVNEIIAQNGYIFMLISKMPMSYQKFLAFFKECGNPIYSNDEDEDSILTEGNKNQYLCVTPQEMFLISTGKRFFKGYSDYDELLRLIIDLETSGLDPKTESIEQIGVRFNRPVLYKGEKKPYEKIISIVGDTEEEKNRNELESIKYLLSIISYFNPDIVTAHNGENFDWNFIITRCEMLGTSIDKICKENNFFDGRSIYKSPKATSLKLGGEVETFNQTVIPGKIVTDSLHAVRRAQALDSNMLKANLKYVTKYSKMQKVNRVYVPGEQISQIWNDNTFSYAFNDENGDWYHIEDNKPIKENYVLQTGKYIVERYLLDDLWECDKVEHRYNTPNFMVCKMLPVPYQKCCTMGTAGQWKMLMLAWSFENGLAIPPFGSKRKFTGGLSRLLCVGWIPKVAKFDYNSLYPSIDLTWKIQSPLDLSGVTLKLLEYVLTEREKYKGLKKAAAKEKERIKDICEKEGATNENMLALRKAEAEESANDKKQLPLKIFGNSFFGSFGAVDLFPWGDVDCAEQTTCTGRQSLRLMISWFSNLGYKPIVGDTDGFNFQLPDNQLFRYTEENPYIGKGLNREVKKDKVYTGFAADVAEFNDLFMRGKMGLGIDEVVESTINFSRKNYSDYFEDGTIKMVGNTIKSKKMPEYIAKFLSVGIRLLLEGKGQEFIEEYYSYIDKIYNYRIPLKDIASRGKVKKSLSDYIKDCNTFTSAGTFKSRQAWMELAIKANLDVKQGDTIYYINTGKSKSHADAKKVTRYIVKGDGMFSEEEKDITKEIEQAYKVWKKEEEAKRNKVAGVKESILSKTQWIIKYHPEVKIDTQIILNSVLVPQDVIESEADIFCKEGEEYNTAKYIDMFNKRITPLLVCFSKNIRERILVTSPSERQYFTDEETILNSGEPNKPSDQDTIEQLLTMEDKEIKFWSEHPELEIPFLKECNMDWETILSDYKQRLEKERMKGINVIREMFDHCMSQLTADEATDFLENGKIPNSMKNIADIDPITGNLVVKDYPDTILISLSEFIEELTNLQGDADDDN